MRTVYMILAILGGIQAAWLAFPGSLLAAGVSALLVGWRSNLILQEIASDNG